MANATASKKKTKTKAKTATEPAGSASKPPADPVEDPRPIEQRSARARLRHRLQLSERVGDAQIIGDAFALVLRLDRKIEELTAQGGGPPAAFGRSRR